MIQWNIVENTYDFFVSPSLLSTNWCDAVTEARSQLNPLLRISYPCENLPQATSAVVCFLTAGVPDGKQSRIQFTGRDYINGALALGASLQKHLTRKDTHRLLLIREGFTIPSQDAAQLEAVGWTIGKAPNVEIAKEHLPSFPRYKTTYTKITAIGLSEYKCALLLDADALVVGSLDDFLSCDVFDRPEYHVAGTLDYYRKQWYHFNTGSILWRTSTDEMNRVYSLTKDKNFMKRYGSDQIFLNAVYPDRTNKTNNELIIKGKEDRKSWGAVVALPWDYNAQTHVEVQLPSFWQENLPNVKIFHFTQKKGWQCEERHHSQIPIEEMPKSCNDKIPNCFCREAYRYWDFLHEAYKKAGIPITKKD